MERYKVEQQRPEYQNGFEQAYYERELAKAMRQMTAREVEKFREWCDRNAVPVVLI